MSTGAAATGSGTESTTSATAGVVPFISNVNPCSVGARQCVSSHIIYSTETLTLNEASVFNLIFCLNSALFSKYFIGISKTLS
ncbi:MAG: hypothetical protein BWY67_02192 [Bacteroidetes bacterium ADurb.Bin397]|nr:MAG: hypothetical protein BWY67_02192 [Bacteroidetes bacterium ADurb.Bin397]